jgi:predicted KAP-like P-loop ATPase
LLNPPPDAAFSPPPINDAVIAEIERQREATDRVIQEARRLAQSHEEFQCVIQQMQTVVTNQGRFSSRLAETEQRVVEFAKDLQRLTTPTMASNTNDVSAVEPEAPMPGR